MRNCIFWRRDDSGTHGPALQSQKGLSMKKQTDICSKTLNMCLFNKHFMVFTCTRHSSRRQKTQEFSHKQDKLPHQLDSLSLRDIGLREGSTSCVGWLTPGPSLALPSLSFWSWEIYLTPLGLSFSHL